MGREIRMVPQNWQHPKALFDDHFNGKIEEVYRPMYDGGFDRAVADYQRELAEWLDGQREWTAGFYVDHDGKRITKAEAMAGWLKGIEDEIVKCRYSDNYRKIERRRYETGLCHWCDVAGEPPRHPDPDDYTPEWSEGTATWYQVYETVSEGTPVTPPFATKEELVEHLVKHGDFWDQSRGRCGWAREAAQQFVEGGYAPSLVVSGGKVMEPRDGQTA